MVNGTLRNLTMGHLGDLKKKKFLSNKTSTDFNTNTRVVMI